MEFIGKYYISIYTKPNRYLTTKGLSKKEEWIQIENVPSKIIDYKDNYLILNSFVSSRIFRLTIQELNDNFKYIDVDEEGNINIPEYLFKFNIEKEYDYKEEIKYLELDIKKINKLTINNVIKEIINDKLFQIINSQGSPECIKIEDYHKYLNKEIILSKHKRIGNEIFNRNCRWCPPITISYDDFIKSKSYPAPLGIRYKDYCLPSELLETIKELINQIFNFENVSNEDFIKAKEILNFLEKRDRHICKYCGKNISINEYKSYYKSSDNYIEICHRNPNERFINSNMYLGHGECNRRQGGYDEKERIKDGLTLAYLNGIIDEDIYKMSLSKL